MILPHCFLTNLVETFISGPTIVQLMEKLVDNIRKYIVKSYRVPSERNNSLNVITAIINIELQKEQNSKENIQYIENLKPVYWQNNLTEPDIQKLMEKEIVEAQNNFQEYNYNYLFSLSFYQLPMIWMI